MSKEASPAVGRSPRRGWRAGALAGALAFAAAAPAPAQAMFDGPAYAFPVPDYVSGLIGNAALPTAVGRGGGRRTTSRKPVTRTPKPPTRRQYAALRFRARPAVTAKIHAEVVRRAGTDPTVAIPAFEAAIADWRRVLRRVAGWRVRDLGDVASFTLAQGWILVNDASATVSKAGLTRIRKAVRRNLASAAAVRRLSDARKQEAAEVLELRMTFFAANVHARETAGDTAGADRERRAARDWLDDVFGVDVAKLRLTRRGFVKR